jgi:hypothetical protein
VSLFSLPAFSAHRERREKARQEGWDHRSNAGQGIRKKKRENEKEMLL